MHIPLTFRKCGGWKLVVTPEGAPRAPRPRIDNAMVEALARAFRWRKMLDTGVYATLEDLARAKDVAPSYVSRILRLTLLAPDIVEAILDGRQPAGLRLERWRHQHTRGRARMGEKSEDFFLNRSRSLRWCISWRTRSARLGR